MSTTLAEREAEAVFAILAQHPEIPFLDPADPDWGTDHLLNDYKCGGCWPGFPKRCECGGLVHAQFEDEIWTGEDEIVILKRKCDSCGDDQDVTGDL